MLKIIKGGLQTTVQDLGRSGFQKYGVIASGAMDPFAHRIANLLVGNAEQEATLEIALVGPAIEFQEQTFIAICGADLSPEIDGNPVKLWRTLSVNKGSVLKFGAPRSGCRTYLAIAGGISLTSVMNSKSTYLRAGIGGFKGRALAAGDELQIGKLRDETADALAKAAYQEVEWQVPAYRYSTVPVVRLMRGRQFHLFDDMSQKQLFTEAFSISTDSDRMGYRLEGPRLSLSEPKELISEAVAFGSIQVPADGNPIILLADRQTTGGYPKIGQIASVDLPLATQLKPGDRIRFKEITLEEAQNLFLEQEQQIRQLKLGIQLKREE